MGSGHRYAIRRCDVHAEGHGVCAFGDAAVGNQPAGFGELLRLVRMPSPRSGRELVCTAAVAARATPGCTRSRSIVAGALVCVDFRREMACQSGRSSRVRRDVPLGANERGAVAIHPVLEAMDLTGRRDGARADRLARTGMDAALAARRRTWGQRRLETPVGQRRYAAKPPLLRGRAVSRTLFSLTDGGGRLTAAAVVVTVPLLHFLASSIALE